MNHWFFVVHQEFGNEHLKSQDISIERSEGGVQWELRKTSSSTFFSLAIVHNHKSFFLILKDNNYFIRL